MTEARLQDLYFATIVVAVASVALFVVGALVARRVSRRTATLLCVLTLGFIFLHVWFVSDKLWVAQVLPVSNVAILGNALLPAVGALAGLAYQLIPGGAVRRGVLLVPLLALCARQSFSPVLAKPPQLNNYWVRGVCIQTSPASCSAAAAATLLRTYGIDTTEEEMARLCLTTARGTPTLGLFRGLKLKTAGTDWDVEVFRTDFQGLRAAAKDPSVLSVGLARGQDVDPRYEQLWGWTPGVPHTVVYFGASADGAKARIGDPSVGREEWFAKDLDVLWHGDGMRLVRRGK